MAEEPRAAQPSIALDASNAAARLVLPPDVDRHTLTLHLLTSLARERGVELTAEAERRLAGLLEQYKADGAPINEVFMRATPPRHGADGFIEWLPGFNPERPDECEHDPGDERVDFYSHHSYVKACREDHVATIHPPTEGEDGRDVTGRTIPATPGKPFAAQVQPSLLRLADGRLLAQTDGLLCYDRRKIWVDPVLDIKGAVDFSTGNIDFEGDVVIHHDIRDRFRVRASGNVTIDGLIDASHIDCAGNLTARRGVAGRDEGTIDVGGDAQIGYIDRARGHIGGSLHFAREIMHSNIFVGRDLITDIGSIIGGCVTVAGDARVADLGAASDTPTTLRLSAVPDEQTAAGQAARKIETLNAKIAQMRKELDAARLTAGPKNPAAAERVTELTFEIGDAEAQIKALATSHPELEDLAKNRPCKSTLQVARQIHGRVTLVIGPQTVSFATGVKGPLRVWLEGSNVVCQMGEGTPQPINQLPGVSLRQAA